MKFLGLAMSFIVVFNFCTAKVPANHNNTNVDLKVTIGTEEGFMNNGWGNIFFAFVNHNGEQVSVKKITGTWKVDGEGYHNWSVDCNLQLSKDKEASHMVTTWMPSKSEELVKAKGSQPYVEGDALLSNGEKVHYTVSIPVAVLPSPIKSYVGKYVSVDLQETTWAKVKNPDKVLEYLDETYKHMCDLTYNEPYNGDIISILEAPRNPYFAYAGNPIILNTSFVDASVARFDNDLVDFGWVHELGHDFDDVIGHWYNYGTFTEFQANIKLSYVVDMMCTEKDDYRIISWDDRKIPQIGTEFNDEYFLPYGERYLASDRDMSQMSSDEYHALFLEVIRAEGWKVMKGFYKTYHKLVKSGQEPPQNQERVLLALAVLDNNSKMDMAPIYEKWRIPLDKEKMNSLLNKYGIK